MDGFDLIYANQGATRNLPVSPDIAAIYERAARAAGIQAVRVTSGGQEGARRTGSHRHDHGGAGDIQLLVDGRALDMSNPRDLPVIEKFIGEASRAGATGIGAGTDYMGDTTFHVGGGPAAVWGAGGKGANAPGWLRQTVASAGGDQMSGGGGTAALAGGSVGDTLAGGAPPAATVPTPRPNPRRGDPSAILALLGPLADTISKSTNPYASREAPPGVGDLLTQFLATATQPRFAGGPVKPLIPPAAAPVTNDPLAKAREAIASIESRGSGDYGALGNPTGGDRAYGRYQVMGANIPSWSQQALGRTLTPDQFLADPAAQDAIFNNIFGANMAKYGTPQDAASVWFTGRPLAQGGTSADVNGMTGNAYVDKFNRYFL